MAGEHLSLLPRAHQIESLRPKVLRDTEALHLLYAHPVALREERVEVGGGCPILWGRRERDRLGVGDQRDKRQDWRPARGRGRGDGGLTAE